MLKNGVLVNDTITVTSTSLVESANPFFTLGGGFRYSFVSEGRLIPYGEIILAGSTAYAVTSEVLGIKYGFDPIAIELGIREEQLFSPSSAPQHLFNVNVGMNYTW